MVGLFQPRHTRFEKAVGSLLEGLAKHAAIKRICRLLKLSASHYQLDWRQLVRASNDRPPRPGIWSRVGTRTAPVIHKLADIALNYVNCSLAAVHSEHYGQFMHGE